MTKRKILDLMGGPLSPHPKVADIGKKKSKANDKRPIGADETQVEDHLFKRIKRDFPDPLKQVQQSQAKQQALAAKKTTS